MSNWLQFIETLMTDLSEREVSEVKSFSVVIEWTFIELT